jgi:hypothetical protein
MNKWLRFERPGKPAFGTPQGSVITAYEGDLFDKLRE